MKAFSSTVFGASAVAGVALTNGQEYQPGNLDHYEQDIYLSKGLTLRVLATAGQKVQYSNGSESSVTMHFQPDGAAVFADERSSNPGGWVYVSNSEVAIVDGGGGVGAFYFDSSGNLFEYKMLLTGSQRNCNGGRTQWNTWISCEEDTEGRQGRAWQVDPFGERDPVLITHGSSGGAWEAFAHDTRDESVLYAFLTEDAEDGAVQRMTIVNPDYTNPWDILLEAGPVDYLYLEPIADCGETVHGTFRWSPVESEGRLNAAEHYPECEGMEIDGSNLRIVSKSLSGFITLNLDTGTYTFEYTGFEGQPDQITTVYKQDGSKMIYLTEEAHPVAAALGQQVGIYTRNQLGQYIQIMFGDGHSSETTGIAFSPDGKHLYFAFQEDGQVFDVTRTDGFSFFGPSLALPDCNQERPIRGIWKSIQQWFFP